MKLKKTGLFAISIAIATMMIVFACSTPPVTDDTNGGDTTKPTVEIMSPSGTISINSNSYTVSGTASDAVGVDGVYFTCNGSPSPAAKIGSGASWSTNVTAMGEGTNTIVVYAKDAANNQSTSATVLIIVDTGAPGATVVPAGSFTTNQTMVLTISVDENHGYWSTNFATFVQFSAGIDVVFTNYGAITNLRLYGDNGLGNISATNTTTYVINYEAIFVSSSGDDANNGLTPLTPVLSIQDAILLATNYGYTDIYVETGTYTQGGGLSNSVVENNYAGVCISNINNISLIGGWDNGFITHTGYSVLDGDNGAGVSNKHIIRAESLTNLTINGFAIINGNADIPWHTEGGGIYFRGISNTLITNCIVSNNIADVRGGGVYMKDSLYITISGTISSNSADQGGGVCMDGGSYNTISATVSDNTVSQFGGGVYIDNSSSNTISGTVFYNTANYGGGMFVIGSYNTISGTISSNIAITDGGGVYLNPGTNTFTFTCIIVSNTASGTGGGVYNFIGAGTQITNIGFTISNNNPNDWYDRP